MKLRFLFSNYIHNVICVYLLQEEIENKIDVADALAVKLLQRFNFSVSAMKTASQHLSEGN